MTTARAMTVPGVRMLGWRRTAGALGLLLLATLLIVNLGRMSTTAWLVLGYPYDLDYGEGIVWQQLANIAAGQGYAPLGVFPAIVYHYPPVYHLVTAALATVSGLDPVVAGRLVSIASTAMSMLAIGWLALIAMPERIGRRAAVTGAALGAAVFAGSSTVLTWSVMMRVDMLACALTLAGLALAATSGDRPVRLIGAAIASALAVYTKQTAIAGPTAIFVALWIAEPQRAWRFLFWCGGLGVAALVALMAATNGEFLRHVLLYNVNRFDPGQFAPLIACLAGQAIVIALGMAAAVGAGRQLNLSNWSALRARLGGSRAELALVMALLYLAVRTASLGMVMKSGASDNYLIDWYAILAVFVAFAIAAVAASVADNAPWPRALVTMLVLVGLPIQLYRLTPAHEYAADPAVIRDSAAVVERIRAADRPVISDDMVLLRRAGQPVLFEPAIAAELAHAKLYDEAAFAGLVRRGAFAFFVTRGARGDRLFDARYNPAVADAMDAAYPRLERHGDLVLHLPLRR